MKLKYSIFLDQRVLKAFTNFENLDFDAEHILSVSKILKPYFEERNAFEKAKRKKAEKYVKPDAFGNIKMGPKTEGYREFTTFMLKLSNKDFEITVTPLPITAISSATGKISKEDIDILQELGLIVDPTIVDEVPKEIDISEFEEDIAPIVNDSSVHDIDVEGEVAQAPGEVVEGRPSETQDSPVDSGIQEEVIAPTNVVDFPAEAAPADSTN